MYYPPFAISLHKPTLDSSIITIRLCSLVVTAVSIRSVGVLGMETLVVLGVELGFFRGTSLEVRVQHHRGGNSVKSNRMRELALVFGIRNLNPISLLHRCCNPHWNRTLQPFDPS
jgi:hypothetical protein